MNTSGVRIVADWNYINNESLVVNMNTLICGVSSGKWRKVNSYLAISVQQKISIAPIYLRLPASFQIRLLPAATCQLPAVCCPLPSA